MSKKQMSNEIVKKLGFENKKVIRFFKAMEQGASKEELELMYLKAISRK